jgi:metal-responsive CopG/Arc/MetJ family transcriptional regulator
LLGSTFYKENATIIGMSTTKISISLNQSSIQLLDLVKKTYRCGSRSQAIARTLELFKETQEQQALEEAYFLSSGQDSAINAIFSNVQNDGLSSETW